MIKPTVKYTYDDLLIEPQFSEISSRKEVKILKLPVISANMTTITGTEMATAMAEYGAYAALPRFGSTVDSVELFKSIPCALRDQIYVSMGVGSEEMKRAASLYSVGARKIIIDVAHGAQRQVLLAIEDLNKDFPEYDITVGNFGSPESVADFLTEMSYLRIDALKLGIGPGSGCLTRGVTGVGYPQASLVYDTKQLLNKGYFNPVKLIADGGIKQYGDVAKAIALGADLVMIGGLFAGTNESAGGRVYKGSASLSSYQEQGKVAPWRAVEGAIMTVKDKGPVVEILQQIEGGLRSACSYTGSENLYDFQKTANLIVISPSCQRENGVGEVKL